jgi:hypothetical protein
MMLRWPLTLALVLAAVPAQSPVQRPRDPWVFRSVLDERPRMVTVALAKDLWIAYDAADCGLYKAWKGGVHFDGAVYTTVHGPQPTSEGTAYVTGKGGKVWRATASDGKRTELTPRWRGYVLARGEVHLRYDVTLPDGTVVSIEETPEFVRPETLAEDPSSRAPWLVKGLVGLRRSFAATGLPSGWTISVAVQADCVGYFPERLQDVVDVEVTFDGGAKGRSLSAAVPLDAALPRNDLMLFFRPPPEPRK